MRPTDYDPVLQAIDRQQQEQSQRTIDFLVAEGRPDLAEELKAKLRDIYTGVDGARATWNALTPPQKRALVSARAGELTTHPQLRPNAGGASRTGYGQLGRAGGRLVWTFTCFLSTARCLCARDLLHVDGGALSPEAKVIITERGKFVLAHGERK